jgi:parallel beta-helix repeat protein
MSRAGVFALVLFILIGLLLAASARLGEASVPSSSGTINADGTVELFAPIQRVGDTYTLTDDMVSMSVCRSGIVLDGNGHTLQATGGGQGGIYLKYLDNVTISNFTIRGPQIGIYLEGCSNVTVSGNTITGTTVPVPTMQYTGGVFVWGGGSCTISGNNLTGNMEGIHLGETEHNVIVDNNLTGNTYGIHMWGSSNNTIYGNSFVNNAEQAKDLYGSSFNIWDDGSIGNFWSDYNGTDADGDGLGDSPYVVGVNNMDRFPLMEPFIIPVEKPEPTPSEPFPAAPVAVASAVTVAAAAAGLLVYFKKRKR